MHIPPIISTNFGDQTSSEELNNGKTHELIDPTHPSTPLCRLSPPSILDTPVVVKYIHSHDMFPLRRSLVQMNLLTLSTAANPSWQFIQLYWRTFIYPKASKDSYVFVSGWHCLYVRALRPLFVALWFSVIKFDLGYGVFQMLGHYDDTRKNVRRAFGTPVSCWGTKSWLQRLYVPVHAFQ